MSDFKRAEGVMIGSVNCMKADTINWLTFILALGTAAEAVEITSIGYITAEMEKMSIITTSQIGLNTIYLFIQYFVVCIFSIFSKCMCLKLCV